MNKYLLTQFGTTCFFIYSLITPLNDAVLCTYFPLLLSIEIVLIQQPPSGAFNLLSHSPSPPDPFQINSRVNAAGKTKIKLQN